MRKPWHRLELRARSNVRKRRQPEMVAAAAKVFARRGYHGASTQDIADVLGIRQASLYYYFAVEGSRAGSGVRRRRRGLRAKRAPRDQRSTCSARRRSRSSSSTTSRRSPSGSTSRSPSCASAASCRSPRASAFARSRCATSGIIQRVIEQGIAERGVPRRSRRPHGHARAARPGQFGRALVRRASPAPPSSASPRSYVDLLVRGFRAGEAPTLHHETRLTARPAGRACAQRCVQGIAYRAKRPRAFTASGRWSDYAREVARVRRGLAAPSGCSAASASRSWATRARSGCSPISGAQACGRHRLRRLSDRLARPRSTTSWATAAPSFFVAEDQEYVDKILALRRPAARRCAAIVVIDESAMFGYDHPKLRRFADAAEALGGDDAASRRSKRSRAKLDPRDPAFIVYTSGTTGHPEGRARRAREAPRRGAQPGRALPDARRARASHRRLPAAVPHPRARHRHHAAAPVAGSCRTSARTSRTCRATLFEVAPTVLVHGAALPPEVRLAGAGGASAARRRRQARRLRRRRCASARAQARARWDGQRGRRRRAATRSRAQLVFKPMLEQARPGRGSSSSSAAARRCRRETMALWQIWGVNVVEIYGQTEDGRRHHHRPARAVSAARATSARSPPAGR